MKTIFKIFVIFSVLLLSSLNGSQQQNKTKKLAYLVSDISIPFWSIMAKGIKSKALEKGYEVTVYSANNLKANEIKNTVLALKSKVDGLIISPINSSTAVTIIKFAKNANIPVVVSDIGSDNKDYVSFISSNNFKGAYNIGKVLVEKMQDLNIDKTGSVGIISIPQKRANGKARTKGFMKALNEANIKSAGLLQQVDFSKEETYNHASTLIKNNSDLKALWLQGSDKYQGALDAIKDNGKENEILLICFDAEPEFIDMIQDGSLVGAAMQQPFLMGEKAVENIVDHINGKKVKKNEQLEVLAISHKNIKDKLPIIKRNVLGLSE